MYTDVLIIGGGATGTGIVRDLSLRGISCILVEQNDINAGATGANHGLLHSGARYVAKDIEAARECHFENHLLKQMAPQCIEETGGLFVAVKGDDEKYIADFPVMCQTAGLPCEDISIDEAMALEPSLSKDIIAAYRVNDASIDPFKLSIDNLSDAVTHGAKILRHHEVTCFLKKGSIIYGVELFNHSNGKKVIVKASEVINATGAWADIVAARAGVGVDMLYSKGSLLVTSSRLNSMVINRLRQAADADILVPGGTVSIIGTTSVTLDSLDDIRPTSQEVDYVIAEGSVMVPELSTCRYIRAYSGVRPLVHNIGADGRTVSRNYSLIDHESDGIENFITITGGKLSTYRLMAEKTSDLVCKKLNNDSFCLTDKTPLPESDMGRWVEPGKSSKYWFMNKDSSDTLLCECEMVSKSMVDSIVDCIRVEGKNPDLKEIGLRSRVGKGPCQGFFCSFRIASHLYDTGVFVEDQGLSGIKDFIGERWKGLKPLVRQDELVQTDLQEAFLCGLLGL